MSNEWAFRRALKDKDLYDPRRRVRVDLDEIAHPLDIEARRQEFRTWDTFYEDLAGLGATYRPRSLLVLGVGLGYSAYALCYGSLLSGVKKIVLRGVDTELDQGPPHYGYRTLAIAAETFKRHLPEAKGLWFRHDYISRDLPLQLREARFAMVVVDGDPSEDGTVAALRLGWSSLAADKIMIVLGCIAPDRQRAIATFMEELIEHDEPFSSQFVWNEIGFALIRKD